LGLAKEPKEKQITGQVRSGRLFVETEPKDARIRILNIIPKFFQGIELEPGSYHVEVSAKGYEKRDIWVRLRANEAKNIRIQLERIVVIPKGSEGEKTVYVTDNLNLPLRTGPSSQRKVIALVKSGDEIRVLKSSNAWAKVRTANGKEGWVISRYLTEFPTNKNIKTAYIIDILKLPMRKFPSDQAKIIEVLKSGNELKVLKSLKEWTKVIRANGKEGWMLTRYLINNPPNRWCVEGNCLNGHGTYVYLARKYTGQFKNGVKDGKGMMIWKNGSKYIGEFQNDRINGQGEMIYPDGTVEHGLYENSALIRLIIK
jgi:SH3-like domain-containing protein